MRIFRHCTPCWLQPLSGERRAVFCHIKPGLKTFIGLARQQLGHACWVVDSRQLLEARAFGPGQPHPQLASRCGDVTLLARADWSIRDTLPTRNHCICQASTAG
jgi:hypothetical protein